MKYAFCLFLAIALSLQAERMRPEEEPEEVGLTSIGSSYFPKPEGTAEFPFPNAGFEDGEVKSAQGWTLWGWESVESDDAPEGSRYLQAQPGEKVRAVFDGLPVESWQAYLLSLWLRSGEEIRGSFFVQSNETRFGAHVPLQLPNTNGQWKRVGFYVRAALGATEGRWMLNLAKAPELAIDDVRFREATEAEFSRAYAGWRAQYPKRDLSPRPHDGKNLALFVQKLTKPREPVEPLLVMGIGSSYTNMLGNGERLVQWVREKFPNAPPVHYKKHVGSAVNYDYTKGWMRQMVVEHQPDLVILYSGGEAEDLNDMLTHFRAHSTADIIVASLHLRERDEEISPETINTEQWDAIREVCEAHGVEFVENRREWAAYLYALDQDIPYLLKDAVHQNDHGALVINENIVRHIRPHPNPAYDPGERERRIVPENNTFTFTGNRIDLIGTKSPDGGTLKVKIDGIPAKDYPAFHTTLIVPGEDNHRPERGMTADHAPHAVFLGPKEEIVPQTWTIRMTSDMGDYALIGSVTGPDGTGNNGTDFTSISGQITVPAALWRRRLEDDGSHSNKSGDTFTWTVYRATTPEVSFKGSDGERFRISLVQNADNREHTIELIPLGGGEIGELEFDLYKPPLK